MSAKKGELSEDNEGAAAQRRYYFAHQGKNKGPTGRKRHETDAAHEKRLGVLSKPQARTLPDIGKRKSGPAESLSDAERRAAGLKGHSPKIIHWEDGPTRRTYRVTWIP